jgi:tRNA (guanine37-N1)-methyltransferase
MVMKPEPFFEAVETLAVSPPIVLVSARGAPFTQAAARRYAAGEDLTILCGHYKDVDQRVADHLATEEVSLGPFVLSGGEPAALAIVDATVRLLSGAMSDHESAYTDSHWEDGLSAPSYTRPPVFRGFAVPDVLLSGDHARIAAWRRAEAARLTEQRRGQP